MGSGGLATVPIAQIGPVTVTGTFAPGDVGFGAAPGLPSARVNDPSQWGNVSDPTGNLASLPMDLATVGAGRAVGAIRAGQGPGAALREFVQGSTGLETEKPDSARTPAPPPTNGSKQDAIEQSELARQAQEQAKQQADAHRREKERQQREQDRQRREEERRKKESQGYTPFLGDFAQRGGPGRPTLADVSTPGRYGGPRSAAPAPVLNVPLSRAGQRGVRARPRPKLDVPTRAGHYGGGYGARGRDERAPAALDVPLDQGPEVMSSIRSGWSDVVGIFNPKKAERMRRRETEDRLARTSSSGRLESEIEGYEARAVASDRGLVATSPAQPQLLRAVGIGALALSGLVVLYFVTRRK